MLSKESQTEKGECSFKSGIDLQDRQECRYGQNKTISVIRFLLEHYERCEPSELFELNRTELHSTKLACN